MVVLGKRKIAARGETSAAGAAAGAARAAEEAPRGSADADGPNVRVGAHPWHKNAVYTQVSGVDPERGAFTRPERRRAGWFKHC